MDARVHHARTRPSRRRSRPRRRPSGSTESGVECRLQHGGRDAAQQVERRRSAGGPSQSSTLLPKIQRNHMLPIRCIQPPCRNIEVSTVCQLPPLPSMMQALSGPDRECRAGRRGAENVAGNEAEPAYGRRERGLRAEALQQYPGEDVRADQAIGGIRRREVRVVIPDREHAPIVLKCRATGSQSLVRAPEGRETAARLACNNCEPVARHSLDRGHHSSRVALTTTSGSTALAAASGTSRS